MNLTDLEYRESAWCEVLVNNVPPKIAFEAWNKAESGEHFDANVQAAIQAGEWLNGVVGK